MLESTKKAQRGWKGYENLRHRSGEKRFHAFLTFLAIFGIPAEKKGNGIRPSPELSLIA